MIARHWRGWTGTGNAEAYENFLRERILPEIAAIPGHRGATLLRRDAGEEAEFIVMNYFESLEAVKRFAGENYAAAVIEPEAKALLCRWDAEALHYEVRQKTG